MVLLALTVFDHELVKDDLLIRDENLFIPFPYREYLVHTIPFTPSNVKWSKVVEVQQPAKALRGGMNEHQMNLSIPRRFLFSECLSAHVNVMQRKITCFQGTANLPIITKTIVLGTDIFTPNNFQHDLINGIPTVGMVADYLLEDLDTRWILSGDSIADVYAVMTNNRSIIRISSIPDGGFWASNIIVPFVDWTYEGLSTDSYPRGSFWPTEVYNMKMVELGHFSHSFSSRYVLFLQRKGPRRFLTQESEIIDRLSSMLRVIGWSLVPFPHFSGMSPIQQRQLFYGSSVIIGLHGGAFSNIPFAHHDTVVIEINNDDSFYPEPAPTNNIRNVFANMALSRNLRYFRFVPDYPFDYETANGIELSDRKLDELETIVKHATSLF